MPAALRNKLSTQEKQSPLPPKCARATPGQRLKPSERAPEHCALGSSRLCTHDPTDRPWDTEGAQLALGFAATCCVH